MSTKTHNLCTIYNYLLTNEKTLRITDIQIVKKGKFSGKPYVKFRCIEGPTTFTIYHTKPLLSNIKPTFEFVMSMRIRPENWQGSYDDLMYLGKSLLYFNDQVVMEYAEKHLDTVLFNQLTYNDVKDFLRDIDKIITHYYNMALKLYVKIDNMEVDFKNSILIKSLFQKYELIFRSHRMFAIASEIF